MAKGHELTTAQGIEVFTQSLFSYADDLEAWAWGVSKWMLSRAQEDDAQLWKSAGVKISKGIKRDLEGDLGRTYALLQARQVELITSLPLEASKKVHEWAKETLESGGMYQDVADLILKKLGGVTESRAVLIARTECSRARTSFTQTRAKALGCTHYIWRTVGDGSVRERHAELEGQVISWDNPPICEWSKEGPVRAHAGQVWNCRCFPEPIIPDDDD